MYYTTILLNLKICVYNVVFLNNALYNKSIVWIVKLRRKSMIKTPEDLLKFMRQIDYEWMDKHGDFHKDIVPEMYENY